MPSPLDPPSGCNFRTRCAEVFDPCATVGPALQEIDGDRRVACHPYGVEGTEVERSPHPNRGEGGEDLLVGDTARSGR